MSSKLSGGCFSIFLGLILAVSLLLNGILFFAFSLRNSDKGTISYAETHVGGTSGSANKIVEIDLKGLISGSGSGDFGDNLPDDIRLQLRQAADDAAVKGVILRIDSPGGEVTASDEIYHYVAQFRDKKPVTVYMESVAASGGYYSAMGGSYIIANELSLTGSIGVILETFTVGDLLGKLGVKALVIKSGKMKDLLSPFREATPEEIAYIQSLINETYDRFVGVVAKERKLDVNVLRNGIADGRVLSGKQAKEAGLIDATGYFEDAMAKEMELAKIGDAELIRYQAPFDWQHLFKTMAASSVRPFKVELGSGALPLASGRLYYLPASAVGY